MCNLTKREVENIKFLCRWRPLASLYLWFAIICFLAISISGVVSGVYFFGHQNFDAHLLSCLVFEMPSMIIGYLIVYKVYKKVLLKEVDQEISKRERL